MFVVVVVQLLCHAQFFDTPWIVVRQASLSFSISRSLLKLRAFESVMPSNILSFVIPFFYCLQSFPASGSFLMSQLFTSSGQRIRASASASVLPMNSEKTESEICSVMSYSLRPHGLYSPWNSPGVWVSFPFFSRSSQPRD